MRHCIKQVLAAALLILLPLLLSAQAGELTINLAALDGTELTPDNILSFQVQSNGKTATACLFKGQVRYRATGLWLRYTFQYTLRPGLNVIDGSVVHPQYSFSQSGLRELFLEYKKLPEGDYEYCVSVTPQGGTPAETIPGNEVEDCLNGKADDVFLINLVDPENKAKIHEYNPVLSWVVNYPFASALTYRVRVAPIEAGQNVVNAIARNNPVYQEGNLAQTSITYPVYAKPLEAYQLYGWTVDAYYKGILLGGAEPWMFTIIEDSVIQALPHESFFVDVRKEENNTVYYAVGEVKLKYILSDKRAEDLNLTLTDKDGKTVKLPQPVLKAIGGDNRFVITFKDTVPLKHLGTYLLTVSNSSGQSYKLPIRYVNPDLL